MYHTRKDKIVSATPLPILVNVETKEAGTSKPSEKRYHFRQWFSKSDQPQLWLAGGEGCALSSRRIKNGTFFRKHRNRTCCSFRLQTKCFPAADIYISIVGTPKSAHRKSQFREKKYPPKNKLKNWRVDRQREKEGCQGYEREQWTIGHARNSPESIPENIPENVPENFPEKNGNEMMHLLTKKIREYFRENFRG